MGGPTCQLPSEPNHFRHFLRVRAAFLHCSISQPYRLSSSENSGITSLVCTEPRLDFLEDFGL